MKRTSFPKQKPSSYKERKLSETRRKKSDNSSSLVPLGQDSQSKPHEKFPPQKEGEFAYSIRIQLTGLLQKSLFFSIFLQIIVAIYLYAIFQAVQQKKVQEMLIESRNYTLMLTGNNKGSVIQT